MRVVGVERRPFPIFKKLRNHFWAFWLRSSVKSLEITGLETIRMNRGFFLNYTYVDEIRIIKKNLLVCHQEKDASKVIKS